MNATIARKSGGAKLSRSETVTVRLDPKLRYLANLAARQLRRTLSSYIELTVERGLADVEVEFKGYGTKMSISDITEDLWDVDEATRFTILAFNSPSLLSYEEQVLWKCINENPTFWTNNSHTQKSFLLSELKKHWETLKKITDGELDERALPSPETTSELRQKLRDEIREELIQKEIKSIKAAAEARSRFPPSIPMDEDIPF